MRLPLVEIRCANPDCDIKFVPTRHGHKFHDKECCKVLTNKRHLERYHAERERKAGKKRLCQRCRATSLSRYNETNTCNPCLMAEKSGRRSGLLSMVSGA